jgi:ferric-dicitrate binding protein FerR (iron transport regulator)
MAEPGKTFEELTQDLLAGRLDPGDAPALSRVLEASPVARRDLDEQLLVHALLTARSADPTKALANVKGRLRASQVRRRLLWAAALAASVIVAIGLLMLFAPRKAADRAVARLVSGSVKGIPAEATPREILPGQSLATGDAPASLECNDGSRVELNPASRIILRGQVEADRCRVELVEGAIRCATVAGDEPFRVCTPVGDVVTEGTEFGVRLAAGQRGFAVTVTQGSVRVERPGVSSVRVPANRLWVSPTLSAAKESAELTLELLFPGERVQDAKAELEAGLLELEGKIGGADVEATVEADGTVRDYSRELPREVLPAALPQAVRRAVQAAFKGRIEWVAAEVKYAGGTTGFEVELQVNGKKLELKLDANGNRAKDNEREEQREER